METGPLTNIKYTEWLVGRWISFSFKIASMSFRLLAQFQFDEIVSAPFSIENASNFRRASKIWFN